jgi:hypothetical protein
MDSQTWVTESGGWCNASRGLCCRVVWSRPLTVGAPGSIPVVSVPRSSHDQVLGAQHVSLWMGNSEHTKSWAATRPHPPSQPSPRAAPVTVREGSSRASAVTRIQKVWRGQRCRREGLLERAETRRIAALRRRQRRVAAAAAGKAGVVGRHRKQWGTIAQQAGRMGGARREGVAALMIQRAWRGWGGRRRAAQLRRTEAARLAPFRRRRHVARKGTHSAMSPSPSAGAAVTIQRVWRGGLGRQRAAHETQAEMDRLSSLRQGRVSLLPLVLPGEPESSTDASVGEHEGEQVAAAAKEQQQQQQQEEEQQKDEEQHPEALVAHHLHQSWTPSRARGVTLSMRRRREFPDDDDEDFDDASLSLQERQGRRLRRMIPFVEEVGEILSNGSYVAVDWDEPLHDVHAVRWGSSGRRSRERSRSLAHTNPRFAHHTQVLPQHSLPGSPDLSPRPGERSMRWG